MRDAEHQSERDFPCMLIQNGITDSTKMCGSQQVGNCFVLLCVMHTHSGQRWCGRKWKIGKSPWKIQKLPETVLMQTNYSVPCHKGDGDNILATRYNHKITLVGDTYWLFS